jgi:signal transduction histidine kinase
MRRKRSLGTHLWLGAILWTTGLFFFVGVVHSFVILHHPNVPRVLHIFSTHAETVLVVSALFMVGGFIQVRRGLSSITQLRSRLANVHDGRKRQVEGEYPAEVQPLVNDLNALLDHREQAVKRALAKAGDLAHGLKTPLAVLSQEADRVRESGQADLASAIHQQWNITWRRPALPHPAPRPARVVPLSSLRRVSRARSIASTPVEG